MTAEPELRGSCACSIGLDVRYNLSYTRVVKTAISIPDEVFEAAEALAERLGMSRSELYATAVARYVAAMRSEGVTARLNEVYSDGGSTLDPALLRAQLQAIGTEEW